MVADGVPLNIIHVGQVIIYVRLDSLRACDGETIVRSAVGITNKGLITQGDNRITNPSPDSWSPIPATCVKEWVVLAVPYLDLISMVIPSPYNYLHVGLILLLVFLNELRDGKRDVESGSGQMPSKCGDSLGRSDVG